MKNLLGILVLAFGLSFVWAMDWPRGEQLTLSTDDGQFVGVGTVDDSKLELDILAGYSGFVRLAIAGVAIDGFINMDGTITLISDAGLVDLREVLAASGLGLDLTFEDRLDISLQTIVVNPLPGNDDDDDDDDDDRGSSNRDDDDDTGSNGRDDDDDSSSGSGSSDNDNDDNDDNDDRDDDDNDDDNDDDDDN